MLLGAFYLDFILFLILFFVILLCPKEQQNPVTLILKV